MGLLDDAIREHLELKRRRGADPGEVAREQHEALDPVERERAPLDESGEAAGADAGANASDSLDELATDAPPVGASQDAPGDFADAPLGVDQAASAGVAGETAELDMRTVLGDDAPMDEEPSAPSGVGGIRAAAVAEAPPPEDAAAGGDSLEWEMSRSTDAHDDAGLVDDEPAEDVLEETPDFLRDTPEQDRLWFEQQPPRDFDFDK
jgi:hypothetical protein